MLEVSYFIHCLGLSIQPIFIPEFYKYVTWCQVKFATSPLQRNGKIFKCFQYIYISLAWPFCHSLMARTQLITKGHAKDQLRSDEIFISFFSNFWQKVLEQYGLAPWCSILICNITYLTRALEGAGAFYSPHHLFFRKYLKNGVAQRRQIWTTCAQIKNTSCVQILISQVKRSGHQVKSKSDLRSGTGFKIKDGAVGKVLVQMFSNFQD